MVRHGNSALLWVVGALLTTLLTGCTGIKWDSIYVTEYQSWDTLSSGRAVALRALPPLEGLRATGAAGAAGSEREGNAFLATLREELEASELFRKVEILQRDESPGETLLLETVVVPMGRSGQGDRVIWGTKTGVYVTGRLIDPEEDMVLVTFSCSRLSAGGPLGQGGLLAAGDEDMAKQLMEWVAEDVVDILEKRKAEGSP